MLFCLLYNFGSMIFSTDRCTSFGDVFLGYYDKNKKGVPLQVPRRIRVSNQLTPICTPANSFDSAQQARKKDN